MSSCRGKDWWPAWRLGETSGWPVVPFPPRRRRLRWLCESPRPVLLLILLPRCPRSFVLSRLATPCALGGLPLVKKSASKASPHASIIILLLGQVAIGCHNLLGRNGSSDSWMTMGSLTPHVDRHKSRYRSSKRRQNKSRKGGGANPRPVQGEPRSSRYDYRT